MKKANRKWYEIWVPQNPEAWKHRKIVFRDISEKPQFWLDDTGAIVNGDCYWIDINPDTVDDVVYLALAVANSSFIEKFYDVKFNNKLYSGKRRYQTQYVEQFPIPYYGSNEAKDHWLKRSSPKIKKECPLMIKQSWIHLLKKCLVNQKNH